VNTLLALLSGFTLSFTDQAKTPIQTNDILKKSIQQVEYARVSTITALQIRVN